MHAPKTAAQANYLVKRRRECGHDYRLYEKRGRELRIETRRICKKCGHIPA